MSAFEAVLFIVLGALLLFAGQLVAVLAWAFRRWGSWR